MGARRSSQFRRQVYNANDICDKRVFVVVKNGLDSDNRHVQSNSQMTRQNILSEEFGRSVLAPSRVKCPN